MVDRTLHRLWRRARMSILVFQVMASVMAGMAVNAAMKYERALRSIFTLMEDAGSATAEAEQRFRDMDATIRRISTSTKTMPQDLAAGMYDVVSTGFDAASATLVLESAARGAYAGLTQVDTATALLTGTLQAYRQEGESSMDLAKRSGAVMDMFFNAVNVGVFTFEELASKFGDVASTAAAFGVELPDLLAFLSTATVRGIGLDEAITSARQTLLAIAASTPKAQEALAQLFGSSEKARESFSAQALAEKGLIGVMGDLSAVIGGKIDKRILEMASAMEDEGADAASFLAEKIGISVEAFTDLFPNVRALKGVLAVSGPGLETYGEHFDTIANNMGAVDRAAAEIDKSASGALQGLKAIWEQFKIDVGGIAIPWIKGIADSLVEWWGGIPARFAQEKVDTAALAKTYGIQELPGMMQREWDNASPGERIGFILQTAWSDALDALNKWFDGAGQDKVTSIGEKMGRFIGDALMSIAGVEGQAIEDNVFYKIGRAAARGFAAGFKEEFSAGDFFGSLFGGESVVGNILMGYLGLKYLPKLLTRAAGGAAAGGGAGAGVGAAAGGLGGWWGGLGLLGRLTAIGSGAAIGGAIQEGTAGDFFSRILSSITFGRLGNANAGQGPGLGMGTQGPPNRNQILAGMTGGVGAAGELPGMAQFRSALETGSSGIETGAERILNSGGRMQSAAAVMLQAANRLANTKLTVPGGGGGGNRIAAANGFEGTVSRPTIFLAGEGGGPEDVSIRPRGRGSGGPGPAAVSIRFGDVYLSNDYDVKKMMAAMNIEIKKAFGNG